jgi:hypothetical protein
MLTHNDSFSSDMSQRVYEPLIFSIDNRIEQRHVTLLDLRSKNLKRIEPLAKNVQFDVVQLDSNEINKIEHLDTLTHLIEVSEWAGVRHVHSLRLALHCFQSSDRYSSTWPIENVTEIEFGS